MLNSVLDSDKGQKNQRKEQGMGSVLGDLGRDSKNTLKKHTGLNKQTILRQALAKCATEEMSNQRRPLRRKMLVLLTER